MPKKPSEQPMLKSQMNDCIRDCTTSYTVCLETAKHLQQKGSKQADVINIVQDCAEINGVAARSMSRDSSIYGYICQACAEVSNHCSEVAAEIGENDCANACRASANSCQQMLKMV